MYYQPELNLSPDEILLYSRKSRSDDPLLTVEEVLQKHETILDEWAMRTINNIIPEQNRFREVVSGETINERPEFQRVLKMIESPKYKAILCVEVQRLSRGDLEDAGRLIKLLRYTNTLVITPPKTYDLRDEYDRDAFERELKRGNEFLEYQKKIMNRGRLLSVSQGNYIASRPPYGFDKVWITEGKRKCPTLAENKEQADVVRMIFDLYVNKDMGRPTICKHLDSLGIKPPRGEHWSQAGLKDLLENVHYIGKVKWNWRKTVKIIEDSEVVKTRPKSKIGEYLIYEGKHDAIISEELFNAAKEKQGKHYRAKPSTKIRNPLAGLLYCHCGRAMSLKFFYKKDGTERSAPRLSCEGQIYCNTGSCRYQDIVKHLESVLEDCIEDFELRIENNAGDSTKLHAKLIKNLEERQKALNEKELAQWEAQSDPDPANRMPQEIFKQLNAKLRKEKEEVQQALCKAYESMPDPIDYEEKIIKFQKALDALRDPNADPQTQNKLLKACIDRIEYKREKPHRLKREPGEKKGTRWKTSGGHWSEPPIELEVKLRV